MPSSQTLYRAPFLPGADAGNITAETQLSNGRSSPLILQLPGNGSLANRSFRIRIAGRVATTTNITFQLACYFGFSTTIASNTQIANTSGVTVNNTTSSFELWVDCQWSADANSITGAYRGQIGNSVVGPTALINTASANPNRDSSTSLASGATYGFTVTGLFSGSSAGNHAFVDDFSLEAV